MAKILFFTTAVEHTTFRKTARMLRNEGAKVHIMGFTRNNFPEGERGNLSIESLGAISHGNYFLRLIKLLKFLVALRKRADDYDTIYNFTLDTLLISKLALIFKKKTWVYQVQDIRKIYFGTSLKSRIARLLEGQFIKKIDVLVVSSENYYSEYYRQLYGIDVKKVQVIENKLVRGSVQLEPMVRNRHNNRIVIGYFGVMRCKRSWEILREVARRNKESFELYMRGKPVAIPSMEQEVSTIENILFEGLYRSPDDLNDLYNQVDLVWACYPFSEDRTVGNWKLARTIRFYEACAFGKPIVVQKGTPQEQDVLQYNIGLVVDMNDVEQCIKLLESIDHEKLELWRKNILKLDSSFFYHDKEYKQLLNKIQNIQGEK